MPKYQSLRFEIKNTGTEELGFFIWGRGRDELFEELSAINKTWKDGTPIKYKDVLNIFKKDEQFFPALIMISEMELNERQNHKAIVTIKKALQLAHSVIPESYEGAIYSTEQPYNYFTAMRVLVHLEKELGNDAKSIKKVIDYGKMRLSLTQEQESGAIN